MAADDLPGAGAAVSQAFIGANCRDSDRHRVELTPLPVRDGPALARLLRGRAIFLVRTERARPVQVLLVAAVVVGGTDRRRTV